jgi:hypothetical protein
MRVLVKYRKILCYLILQDYSIQLTVLETFHGSRVLSTRRTIMFFGKNDKWTDRIHSASPARKYGILGKNGILFPF